MRILLTLLVSFPLFYAASASAQNASETNIMSVTEKAQMEGASVDIRTLTPLVYTSDEYILLQEAMRQFTTRPPTQAEIQEAEEFVEEEEVIDPGIRELSLAGIVYRGQKDWTIWFNQQRVTPQAIPEQVLDLKVRKNYIDLKWYDEYTNRIYPVRLRPHQRFNLDSRIFLPG